MAPRASALPFLALCLATLFPSSILALTQEYCSSDNTASDTDPAYWQWQSNGWCSTHCGDDYAFAIVQKNNCWCSNYIPADQVDVSDCSDTCPGFPSESCGNNATGLYGYVALSAQPSGTAGAASSAAPTSKSSSPLPSSTRPTSSSFIFSSSVTTSTVTGAKTSSVQTAKPSSTSSSVVSSSAHSSSKSSTPTSAPSSSWTPTPVTSIQVITESGAVIYKTITSIPTSPSGQLQMTSKKGSNTGTIVGAVVGAVGGLALVGGLIFFLLRRRRQQKEDAAAMEAGGSKDRPTRNASTLSKAGLLRGEKDYPPVAIPVTKRHSSNGTDGISPISINSERRYSKPMFYDQRLNPSALMDLDNGSHTSIATIEDNRDYTRTLNVRNPDPTDH